MALLLAVLGVVERGLDAVDRARMRVEFRRFRRDNPGVRFPRFPDGG